MQSVDHKLLLVSILGSLTSIIFLGCGQESQDLTGRQFEETTSSIIGSVDIRGRVVSEDGKPVEDVTIKYSFREFGDVLINKEIKHKRMKVDGEFRIKRRRITSVDLSVLKLGYYPESWSFAFDSEAPRKNPGGYEEFELEIFLQKKAEAVPLKKYEGILRAEVQGPVSVVQVTRQASGETWLLKDGKKRELDQSYIYLVADEGKNSQLPTTEFAAENDHRLNTRLERGWIRFSDRSDGDGFIVYDPGEVEVWPETGMRRMTKAPQSGFDANLELSAAESQQTVYFYCRINGLYGKGMVTGRPIIAFEDDRQVARAAILMYINPTGSRNVSYLHN